MTATPLSSLSSHTPLPSKIRDRLIALNTCRDLNRGTICRLGLEVDEWTLLVDRPSGGNREPSVARTAAALGLHASHLERALQAVRNAPATAAREREEIATLGSETSIVVIGDENYPHSLYDLALPPPVLYIRGQPPSGLALSMVGSRKMNTYGQEVAHLFAKELASAGLIITSGFARGVDVTAHRSASTVGRTVAVLGCGLDIDYPRGHRSLAEQIEASSGALISEFPLGTEPRPWHFPIRNRVIAGLTIGTLVIQAAIRSGSLITAHHSLELGRDVYAVPGSIFEPLARGPNRLIADGAVPALEPRDILETLSVGQQTTLFPSERRAARPVKVARVRGFPGTVLAAMAPAELLTCEQLADRLRRPIDTVLGALLELELGGHLRREPGPRYRR